MARIFFNGVQVRVEILTSKIRHDNGDNFRKTIPLKEHPLSQITTTKTC
jgi:hypothetical protein